jgi:hypothetical protein
MANCKNTCKCYLNLNFGVKDTTDFGTAKLLMVAPLVASDGTENKIDLTAALNQAYFDALNENADFSKRYQFTPIIEDFTVNVEDNPTVTRASGTTYKLRDGVVTFEMYFDDINADGILFDALKSLECEKIGVNFVDKCNSIAGYKCNDALELVPVASGTWMVQYYNATDSDVRRIRLTFQIEATGNNNFDILKGSDLDDVNIFNIKPLYSGGLKAKVGAATTTTLVVDLITTSKSAIGIPYTGADTVGNWTMTNNTASTTVAITTVVEDAVVDGRYTFTFPAQTAADSVTLKYLDSKGEIIFTTTLN